MCAGAAVVAVMTVARSSRRTASRPWPGAAGGRAENPDARAEHEWAMLRDPATGSIPRGIARAEIEFARRAAAEAEEAGILPVGTSWLSRGPVNVGGRTKALALDVGNENIILAGGVSSGMWKSTDGGRSWRKTTAPWQLHSVSCIAQNRVPGRQSIWYYGTGEYSSGRGGSAAGPLGTNAFYRGDGIFKSIDGGESWTLLPSTVSGTATATDDFDYVHGLATFGLDGVYAATSTGLWKSLDGGASWEHVLSFGPKYPSTEVAVGIDGTVWVTIGGDGPDAGIYRSFDGVHWTRMVPPGWPAKTLRTVIGLVPSNPNKVFFWTDEDGLTTHLYRYVEGAGWTDLRDNLPWGGDITTYGANMLVIGVKPDDEDTLFLGAVNMFRTTDGGRSFLLVDDLNHWGRFHVDQHAFVFYPSNPRRMLVGNDGGVFRTDDNLTSLGQYEQIAWEPLNNAYLTTQFYTVAVDRGTPGSPLLAGGMQDNGCMYTVSSDPGDPWRLLVWGDGGFISIADGGTHIYTSLGATLGVYRNTLVGEQIELTEVTPAGALMGVWMNPMILDPHDSRIMYFPARRELYRNSDLTQIPHVFPPQPTSVNWTKLVNVNHYTTALGMSPALPRRLYYGTNEGMLYRLDNPHTGQPVPVALSQAGLPSGGYVHCINVDPKDADKLLVVFPNYGVVSIFYSEDGGQHWVGVAGNLEERPDGSGNGPSVRWVETLYVQNRPVYFAGTSVGLFSTTRLEGMDTRWVLEGARTIGNVVIDMIDVRQADGLVAVGSHGNGVYTTRVTELPVQRPRRHLGRA